MVATAGTRSKELSCRRSSQNRYTSEQSLTRLQIVWRAPRLCRVTKTESSIALVTWATEIAQLDDITAAVLRKHTSIEPDQTEWVRAGRTYIAGAGPDAVDYHRKRPLHEKSGLLACPTCYRQQEAATKDTHRLIGAAAGTSSPTQTTLACVDQLPPGSVLGTIRQARRR